MVRSITPGQSLLNQVLIVAESPEYLNCDTFQTICLLIFWYDLDLQCGDETTAFTKFSLRLFLEQTHYCIH
jgi:hypothetical protein